MLFEEYLGKAYSELSYPPIICELPSEGIIYPVNSIFSDIGKAFIKKIDGKLEEWSNELFFINNKYYINILLDKYLLFTNHSITDLIVADRDAILVQILLITYGKELSFHKRECNYCSREFEIKDIYIKQIRREKLNLIPYKKNENIFKVTIEGKEILFKFPTVADIYHLEEYQNKFDYSVIEHFKTIIYSIDGNSDIEQLIKKKKINLSTIRKIKTYIEKNTPFIRIVSNPITCPHCSKENIIEATVDVDVLPLSNSIIRKNATNDLLYFLKGFHSDNIMDLPIENRKRLINQDQENLKQEKEKMQQQKNKPKAGQMSLF